MKKIRERQTRYDVSCPSDDVAQRIPSRANAFPTAREQRQIMDLLGRINYQIVQGGRVYIEVGGIVYKTLYGAYWRSVFTGVEHYLLRCEQIQFRDLSPEAGDDVVVDLPISYSREGWLARGQSLFFLAGRD